MKPVVRSASGVFLRADRNIGVLTYSPHTGIFYAIHPTDSTAVTSWLNGGNPEPINDAYKHTLGIGWAEKSSAMQSVIPHLLPSVDYWANLPSPEAPFLINWFITGNCPLACRYCYAEDLMRGKSKEPDRQSLAEIADTILTYNPLSVVLTGGDPLFSPYLQDAIQHLYSKTGLIVDTSGYTFSDRHLELFLKYKISVRISIDSKQPKVHDMQRPIYSEYRKSFDWTEGSLGPALNAANRCLDASIPVTIQTVATKKNTNDLLSFGDKLFRLGVTSWRILKVAPSKTSMEGYRELVGTHFDSGRKVPGKNAAGPYDFVFRQLMQRHEREWKSQMHLQVTENEVLNAVVLVGPDGTFYTESNLGLGKVVIDKKSPKRPARRAIVSSVNLGAHAARYLNVTSTAFQANKMGA